jgi:peroxiredoxin
LKHIGSAIKSFAESWWAIAAIALLTTGVVYQHWNVTHPSRIRDIVTAGEHLPSVLLEGLDRQPITLDWSVDSRSTVLYVFAPSCPWCARNLDAIRALVDDASSRYRFVGISLTRDGLSDYLEKTQYQFPIYVADRGAERLKLRGTPETIVVSPAGRVVKVWLGAYGPATASDISKTFAVNVSAIPLR